MNSKETKSFLSQMQAAYPADLFFEKLKGREAPTIEIWSQALKEVELECATRFLADWMKTNNRVPAACDVYQFWKRELIDKRMRIETQQIEYSGDHVNMLAVIAKQMQERREAEAKAKADEEAEKEAEKRKKYLNDQNQLYVTTFTDGFEEKYKRAEIEIMLKNGDQNEHGKVAKLKVYEDGE